LRSPAGKSKPADQWRIDAWLENAANEEEKKKKKKKKKKQPRKAEEKWIGTVLRGVGRWLPKLMTRCGAQQ
jgi:hypothetical protein